MIKSIFIIVTASFIIHINETIATITLISLTVLSFVSFFIPFINKIPFCKNNKASFLASTVFLYLSTYIYYSLAFPRLHLINCDFKNYSGLLNKSYNYFSYHSHISNSIKLLEDDFLLCHLKKNTKENCNVHPSLITEVSLNTYIISNQIRRLERVTFGMMPI